MENSGSGRVGSSRKRNHNLKVAFCCDVCLVLGDMVGVKAEIDFNNLIKENDKRKFTKQQ